MVTRLFALQPFLLSFALAQPGINFFPHHAGNVWQYRSAFTGEIVMTVLFLRDSVDQIGNTFIWYKEPSWVNPNVYKIDTLNRVYVLRFPSDTSNLPLLYKLDADSGARWTYLRHEQDSVLAKVVRVFPSVVFGHPVMMKKIEYKRYPPAGGFWIGNRYLATGFGFVRWEIEPSDTYVLSGAIIDSVQYGSIVEVIESSVLPSDYQLDQNYPNPFNPATTMRYQIPRKAHVRLEVFTVLGEQMAILVDQVQESGNYGLEFNASHLPTGVYFYRLNADGVLFIRRMLLLR